MACSISHNIYDEELIYKLLAQNLLELYKDASYLIRQEQEKNPKIYIELTKLALRWRIRFLRKDRWLIVKQRSLLMEIHRDYVNSHVKEKSFSKKPKSNGLGVQKLQNNLRKLELI